MKQFKCKCGFQFPYADNATYIQCPSCGKEYGKKQSNPVESVNKANESQESSISQYNKSETDSSQALSEGRQLCSRAKKGYGLTELITGIITLAYAIGMFSNFWGLLVLLAMGWVRYYILVVGIVLIGCGISNISTANRLSYVTPDVIWAKSPEGSWLFFLFFFTIPGIPCIIANIIATSQYKTGLDLLNYSKNSDSSTNKYFHSEEMSKIRKRSRRRLLFAFILILVLIVVGTVIYSYSRSKNSSDKSNSIPDIAISSNFLSSEKSTSEKDKLASDYWNAAIDDSTNGTNTADEKLDAYIDSYMDDYYKSLANTMIWKYPKCLELPENDAYLGQDMMYIVQDYTGGVYVYYTLLGVNDTYLNIDYVAKDKSGRVVATGSSSEVLYRGYWHTIYIYLSKEEYSKLSAIDWNITKSEASYYIKHKEDKLNNIKAIDYNFNDRTLYLTAELLDNSETELVSGCLYVYYVNKEGSIVDIQRVAYYERPNGNKITISTTSSYTDYATIAVSYDYANTDSEFLDTFD